MKLKTEVKSWYNYSLTQTHTPWEGRELIRLTLHPMHAKLFNGTTKYQIFLLSTKINVFGLHSIAWCPWQPLRHCSCLICKQTQVDTQTFMDIFSLPLIQENKLSVTGETKWSLNSKKNG